MGLRGCFGPFLNLSMPLVVISYCWLTAVFRPQRTEITHFSSVIFDRCPRYGRLLVLSLQMNPMRSIWAIFPHPDAFRFLSKFLLLENRLPLNGSCPLVAVSTTSLMGPLIRFFHFSPPRNLPPLCGYFSLMFEFSPSAVCFRSVARPSLSL